MLIAAEFGNVVVDIFQLVSFVRLVVLELVHQRTLYADLHRYGVPRGPLQFHSCHRYRHHVRTEIHMGAVDLDCIRHSVGIVHSIRVSSLHGHHRRHTRVVVLMLVERNRATFVRRQWGDVLVLIPVKLRPRTRGRIARLGGDWTGRVGASVPPISAIRGCWEFCCTCQCRATLIVAEIEACSVGIVPAVPWRVISVRPLNLLSIVGIAAITIHGIGHAIRSILVVRNAVIGVSILL